MQLSDEDIKEFAALWKEEFGEEIPLGEARNRALQILELLSILASSPVADDSGP